MNSRTAYYNDVQPFLTRRALPELRDARRRLDDYIAWLEPYRWRWVGVLTFREGIRTRRARTLVQHWFDVISASEGHPISYFAVREFGGETDHLHYHVLVAGIGSRLRL
jgi:hypothetical protein